MNRKRVVVAMSGGVDSSVAAALLKEEGYEVIGVTMRLWTDPNADASPYQKACCSLEAVDDARRVCQVLDIHYYVMNFEREFESYVINYFVEEYRRGRTPNPCLACNQHVKFKFLMEKAFGLGAEYIATGHYARITSEKGEYRLRKAVDPSKDQSYVLFTLGQEDLSHLLLPIGEMPKSETRLMAAKLNLPVAKKADSQEICFIPDNNYKRFVEEKIGPSKPGKIMDAGGNILGTHSGIVGYTIGQRRGLGIASREPLFVTRIDAEHNVVVVGPREELLRNDLMASQVCFVSGLSPEEPFKCTAKIRYRASEAPAWVIPDGPKVKVEFSEPQRGITPGQAVVFYNGDEVLGGGIID